MDFPPEIVSKRVGLAWLRLAFRLGLSTRGTTKECLKIRETKAFHVLKSGQLVTKTAIAAKIARKGSSGSANPEFQPPIRRIRPAVTATCHMADSRVRLSHRERRNPRQPPQARLDSHATRLQEALGRHGISTVLDEETAALCGETGGIPAHRFSDHVDIAAVLGGDGTMLHAVSRLGDFEKPVAGINIGTLGFLTSCTDDELDEFAAAVADGRFTTSVRTLLEATVHRRGKPPESFTALNEITLARGDTGRLVSLRAR